jgi:hypothetical protein
MAKAGQYLDSDGATVITEENWPTALAGQNQMPKKLAFKNTGDAPLGVTSITVGILQVGTNDGDDQLRHVADTATLPGPWGVTAAAQAGTGSFATGGTKGYKVTALSAIGESAAAMEATVALPGTSSVVLLSWQAVPAATGYRAYRTDTAGIYGGTSRLVQVGSGTTSLNDGGGALTAGSPPADNRTAGWLTTLVLSGAGAGGVWGSTGVRYYRVAALDATGVVIAASLEASVTVDVTTKTVTVSWAAVPDAATYKVYRSTVSGTYTSPALVATVTAPTVSYVDTGTAPVAGQLVAAASYGAPPAAASFGSSPFVAGTSLAINQTVFFWINRVVPLATPAQGNPRLALTEIKEA